MKYNHIVLFASINLILFGASCRSKDPVADNRTDSIVLKLNMTGGMKYYFTTHNETSMSQEVKDNAIETASSIETGMLYEVSNDSSGNLNFTTTYRVFKIKAKENENEREIDAATAGGSIIRSDRVFAAFQNAVIRTTLTPAGEVKAVEGIKELTGNMFKLAGDNEDAVALVQGSLAQYADENF